MNTGHNERKNYVWNMVAGLINAAEAVLLMAVITRTNGIYDAGVLTIAFAIANLLSTIGKFGIRNYQVTDVNGQFTFGTYLGTRIVTTVLMLIVSVVYVIYGYLFKQYAWDKASVILFMCLIYVVEAIEDVFAGLYQKKGRLDWGGKIFSARWVVILGLFSIILISTHNLFYAALISMVISVFCCIILLFYSYRKIVAEKLQICFKGTKQLLSHCLPLFLSAFLQFYLINAPKYAIDDYLTEEVQACYGFIAMPVFVIGLLNSFIYQPILVKMAVQWREHDYQGFGKRIWRQIGIIAMITIVCIAGAYVLGIPVLSLLYHTDLSNYKVELLILLLGGGFLAMVGFSNVLLTIMRKQIWVLYGYAVVSMIAFLTTGQVVKAYEITGAAMMYTILIAVLMVALGGVVYSSFRQGNKLNQV